MVSYGRPSTRYFAWCTVSLVTLDQPQCLAQNCVIAKDIKVVPTAEMLDARLIVRVGGMPRPQTETTYFHYSNQLSYNQRVGCLLCIMAGIYDIWYGWVVVRMAISLKYRKPHRFVQIHITYQTCLSARSYLWVLAYYCDNLTI